MKQKNIIKKNFLDSILEKKYFLVKGKKYKIKYQKDYFKKNPPNTDGNVDLQKRIIYIDNNLEDERKKQVIIHELLHALIFELHLDAVLILQIEEIIVENFTQFFLEFIS